MSAVDEHTWLRDQLERRSFRRLCTGTTTNFCERQAPSGSRQPAWPAVRHGAPDRHGQQVAAVGRNWGSTTWQQGDGR